MIWHPDKFEGEEEKKKAEKTFMDIAAAKEVLTDPGMYTVIVFTRSKNRVNPTRVYSVSDICLGLG